jgi:antitoxin component YwqK of YwqJK toxin-antitoxin module
MLQGVFREYDEDGKLLVQSHWKDHKLNGKFTHWRDINTGVLYETTMYKDDVRVWTNTFDSESRISGNYYYDSQGKGVSSVEYKRLPSGYTVVGTTFVLPTGGLSYKEELLI